MSGIEVHHGVAQVLELRASFAEMFPGYRWVPEEQIFSGDHVLSAFRWSGRIPGSSVEVDWLLYTDFAFEGERVARVRSFTERADALRDTGLPDLPL